MRTHSAGYGSHSSHRSRCDRDSSSDDSSNDNSLGSSLVSALGSIFGNSSTPSTGSSDPSTGSSDPLTGQIQLDPVAPNLSALPQVADPVGDSIKSTLNYVDTANLPGMSGDAGGTSTAVPM